MAKILGNLGLWVVTLASILSSKNLVLAEELLTEKQNEIISEVAQVNISESLAQVTSVSELSDVQPTDWAFQALQSLVERYGCIAGYSDSTYRGNRALTRYEFAAGLNACLDKINELIASSTTNLVAKEDLVSLQRLQQEFTTELTTLRGRVDAVEVQVAELEANQFSTTTKINGEVITYVGDAFSNNADSINNPTLGYRLRLDFNTSFTGEDRLRTRFQFTNLRLFDTGATFGGSPDVAIGGVSNETRFTPSSVTQNGEIRLSQLEYRFPIGEKLKIYLEANTIDPSYVTDTVSPFIDTATGAISNFGQVNPVYFPLGNQAGIAANYRLTKALSLDAGYFGEDSSTGAPNNPGSDSGLFNGGYSAFGQLVYDDSRFKLSFLYLNSYSPRNGVDTLAGSNAAKVIGSGPVIGKLLRS